MPRKTPVREIQAEESAEGPLRRSSRIAHGSPAPTKVAQRRNSSSSDTAVKITKGRRLSLSQENNSESTENKLPPETNAADTPKKTRFTRSASKSPTSLAKDLETRATPARTRSRRGSKSIDEEDTPIEPSSQKSKNRSTRSESKSPTIVKDVEPAKTRTRRGSITEKIAPLEKIEELAPLTPEPKKRTRSRVSSLTEMSQLDNNEETELNKKEIKKFDLETISEAKENDEKEKSIISDSPESSKQDKFKMSPVVVIQKSKTIAELTTGQNSEKEHLATAEETKDEKTEPKETSDKTEMKETVEKTETKGTNEKTKITETNEKTEMKKTNEKTETKEAHEKTEMKKTNEKTETKEETNEKTEMKKTNEKTETKEIDEKTEIKETNEKIENDSSVDICKLSAKIIPELKKTESTVSNGNSDLAIESKQVGEKNPKVEGEDPIPSCNLEPSTNPSSAINVTQNSDPKEEDESTIEKDGKVKEECPIISNNLEPSTSSGSAIEKIKNSDSKEKDESVPQRDTKAVEKCPITSNNLDPLTNRYSTKEKTETGSEENSETPPTYERKEQDIYEKNEEIGKQSKGDFAHNTSDATEEIISLDILPIDRKQSDKIDKLNSDDAGQCVIKKLTPEDEIILKKIDLVLNDDTSADQNGKKEVFETNKPELGKTQGKSENILNVTVENKILDIDVDQMEADILTNKSLNENNQSTPVITDNLKKTYIQTSGERLPPSKNLVSDSKIATSQEDISNKSLSCLLPNQLEMISGSDGSFNINLSLEHVQGFSSQEDLSQGKLFKENSMNESEDELNKSNSSNKENITSEQNKNDMQESMPMSEKNTSLGNMSLKDIEKNPKVLKKQLDNSFYEPMEVDDPSLHIDDVITASKRRSLDIEESLYSPSKKMFKPSKRNSSPMKKESESVLNIKEDTGISNIVKCKTPNAQLEVKEHEQTANLPDISKEDLNMSETKNLNLGENKLNKTDDSNSTKTEKPNQSALEKSNTEQTELSTAEADNHESTKTNIQEQQQEAMDKQIENVQDISDVSNLVNKSVSVDDKESERECISPAFSINSADITDENDEDDIVKDTPKKQNVQKHLTEPSADIKTEVVLIEKQSIEVIIADVKLSPVTKENILDDTKTISETKGEEIDSEPTTLDRSPKKLEEKCLEEDVNELSIEVKLVKDVRIAKDDISDKGTEQVSSTTSNEIKPNGFETDKISETIQENAENTSINDSLNENVDKDSANNEDEKSQSESHKDCSSQKDTESNTLLVREKDPHEDQSGNTRTVSPEERKLKLRKSKSKKKAKLDTSELEEISHSTKENNDKDENDSLSKKKKNKKSSKSSHEISFDEKVESFIEETMKEFALSSDDEKSDDVFVDDMAEEGEEDTPSEGSNDIPCDGESINSSDTYTEDDDEDSYEADSFINDDEDKYELLSGEENFLQDEQTSDLEQAEARQKPISPEKQKKKRQRIITVSESDEETSTSQDEVKKEKTTPEGTAADGKEAQREEDTQINTNLIENKEVKTKEDSSEDSICSNSKTVDVDTPSDFLPSLNDVIHVDSDSSSASEVSDSVEQVQENKDVNSSVVENRSNRKSSITIQDNIKLEDIEDGELSDRISKVVDWFYSGIKNNSDTGNISLNVSLDYADLPPDEENAVKDTGANVNLEKENTSIIRQSKKRKSGDFIGNESPKKSTYEKIADEGFTDASKDSIKYGKLTKPKLSKKSKGKSLQKENQKDESNAEFISIQDKHIPGKPKKKHSPKSKSENQLMLDSKLVSKRLSDDKINYLLPKRLKHSNKADKTSKIATLEYSSNVIKDITSTINKKENIENNISEEVFNDNEVIKTDIIKDKPKKIKKNKKVDQMSDDIANEKITNTVKTNDLTHSKKKRSKKAKEVYFSDEDNTNVDNDFHSISNKKIDKHTPFSKNISESNNEFNVEVENKKVKKLKRLSYPTRKTEIPCSSGVLQQQFIWNTITSKSEVAQKRERRRKSKEGFSQKVLPSKTTNLDDSWESEIFDMSLHPSKSNRKRIDAGTSKKKKTEIDSFSSKDFKNKMLYDSSRIKRMATKVLLRQRKGL